MEPTLTGQAKKEWETLQRLVERDIEHQIDEAFEKKAVLNGWRVRNGLEPIL